MLQKPFPQLLVKEQKVGPDQSAHSRRTDNHFDKTTIQLSEFVGT